MSRLGLVNGQMRLPTAWREIKSSAKKQRRTTARCRMVCEGSEVCTAEMTKSSVARWGLLSFALMMTGDIAATRYPQPTLGKIQSAAKGEKLHGFAVAIQHSGSRGLGIETWARCVCRSPRALQSRDRGRENRR